MISDSSLNNSFGILKLWKPFNVSMSYKLTELDGNNVKITGLVIDSGICVSDKVMAKYIVLFEGTVHFHGLGKS